MSEAGYASSLASDSSSVRRAPSVQTSVSTGIGCWMDCGTSEHLTNIGNARSVKWICGPCNSSRKAIDRQAKDTAECKEALSELKKNLKEYKAIVRNNRFQVKITEGQGNSSLAKALHAERTKLINHSFRTTAEVVSGVSQNTDVLWMAELEYIAYHKYTKGLEHTAATVPVYYHCMCIHNIYIYIYIYISLSLSLSLSLYIYIYIALFAESLITFTYVRIRWI